MQLKNMLNLVSKVKDLKQITYEKLKQITYEKLI